MEPISVRVFAERLPGVQIITKQRYAHLCVLPTKTGNPALRSIDLAVLFRFPILRPYELRFCGNDTVGSRPYEHWRNRTMKVGLLPMPRVLKAAYEHR